MGLVASSLPTVTHPRFSNRHFTIKGLVSWFGTGPPECWLQ